MGKGRGAKEQGQRYVELGKGKQIGLSVFAGVSSHTIMDSCLSIL